MVDNSYLCCASEVLSPVSTNVSLCKLTTTESFKKKFIKETRLTSVFILECDLRNWWSLEGCLEHWAMWSSLTLCTCSGNPFYLFPEDDEGSLLFLGQRGEDLRHLQWTERLVVLPGDFDVNATVCTHSQRRADGLLNTRIQQLVRNNQKKW